MDRREFLHVTAATTLAARGLLPLLAAEPKQRRKGRGGKKPAYAGPPNIFTEPAAIESVTGYLPKFTPLAAGTMAGRFKAKYVLVGCHGSAAKSNNSIQGSIAVAFSDGVCKTTETRRGRPSNTVSTRLECTGRINTVSKWTLESSIDGLADTRFVEKGHWDRKAMTVKAESWTQTHSTGRLLIGRWALLPSLASGRLKTRSLSFDMLDNSTLRPDQTLRYAGEVQVPVAGGKAALASYVQTGRCIVPTHYLVDSAGRVQLITMSAVNWALTELG